MTIPVALDPLNYMADQLNQRAQQIVEKEVEVLIGERKGIPVSADFSAGVSKGKFTTFEMLYVYIVGLLFLLT